jgi:hypothetical protein
VSHPPHDVERLLRAARPEPRPEFVRELERSLIGRRPSRAERPARVRPRLRVLVAGTGLVAGLAAVVVALAVAGLLPFGSSGGRAEAGEDCTVTTVERLERHPHFVRDKRGDLHVRYRTEKVPRIVRRCR